MRSIRPARVTEADALTGLAMRSKAMWGYSPDFMQRCLPELTVAPACITNHSVFVAVAGVEIVGFYSLRPRGSAVELDMLFVEPAHVRKGFGAALLAHATMQARRLGHAKLLIESDPQAEPFYCKAGARRVDLVESPVEKGRYLPLLEIDLAASPGSAPSK